MNFVTEKILPHHDVVFRAPVCDPTYGLPIGDGDTCCLLWMTEKALHVQINNTGLIDNMLEGSEYCGATDEKNAIRRKGAQFRINFPCPIFETIYQKRFEARLSLGDAVASIEAETPFAKTGIRAFASREDKVTVLQVDASFGDPMHLQNELSRWGSRTFMYWYSDFVDDPEIGLDGTASLVEDGCLCITQKLTETEFCIAVKPVSENKPMLRTVGTHGAEAVFEDSVNISHTYYITVTRADDVKTAKNQALGQIREAQSKGTEEIYRKHAKEWDSFWKKSYVSLPEKQDFLENLWYLDLYYANSQMRGAYPHTNFGDMWGVYHDFVSWNCYFHYNMQLSTFPLEAANHPELVETYYRFRREQLPYAQRYAEKVKNGKGAFYTDVSDCLGRMDLNTKHNYTVGSQIAMEMYQHYCYTGDEAFLEQTALPVMRGTAEFYLDKLILGEDGYYHIYGTSGYESPWIVMDDCITDLSMIRVLFATLIQHLPEEEAAVYKERLDRLIPYRTTEFLDDELDAEGNFQWGIGKGRKPLTDHVLSVGDNARVPDEVTMDYVRANFPDVAEHCFGEVRDQIGPERTRRTFGNPEHSYYGFPDTEMAPLFPSGFLSLRDKESELYKLVYNSVSLHADSCMGWCMMPIYLARMGMAEQLERQLETSISKLFIYPQGFANDSQRETIGGAAVWDRWQRNIVRNRKTGEKSTSLAWKFRYLSYEALPIMTTAVNEMLLQSYDGIVRLFPAISEESEAAFRLVASGGWLVDAVYQAGECDVVITSDRGGMLSVAVDHVNGPLRFGDADSGEELEAKEKEGVFTFPVMAGQRIFIKSPNGDSLTVNKAYERNTDVKHLGKATLGAEKEF